MPSNSRKRQLARLAARRQAERSRLRRRRLMGFGIGAAAAIGAGAILLVVFLGGGGSKPSAGPTPTGSSGPSASPPAGAVACGATKPAAAATVTSFNGKYSKPPAMSIDTKAKYLWTLETSCGEIQIELTPSTAPKTVNSIVFLTKQGLYDGNSFHRIAQGFVIQGGDPAGDGTGGPGYTVVDTPPNNAQYPVGAVAMAKTGSDPAGTSGSQFFIVTAAGAQQALAPGGVGQYAIVGTVVKGMDVVNKIAAIPIVNGGTDGTPAQAIYIDKATVTVEK